MDKTPNANRVHIALFGRRNSGKSSLINAITGQHTSVVSDISGTTTDIVLRAMEISPIGACLLIDTPGFDDEGELGVKRVERTLEALERTDIALLLCEDGDMELEQSWSTAFKKRSIPFIPIINKSDIRGDISPFEDQIESLFSAKPLVVSAAQGVNIEQLRDRILELMPADHTQHTILGDLVSGGDLVMLVMPQDRQAPKGRLILPQVQTLRELLDRGCVVVSCTTDGVGDSLNSLVSPPKLIITDSQVFNEVYRQKPQGSMLTSFSILMAGYKGDIESFVEGAEAIDQLTPKSRVLIAEACTHAPLTEDIGRVKLPRMLRQRVGEQLTIEVVAGRDFPEDLTPYDLVIHCGGCMFNRKYILNRIARSREQGVPITNYGVAIAHLGGILPNITLA
ncbi:MAG: [FeFe] hydrogenase H-cluster maturation GTPase HydF [Rikenellaceae bacterium]